MLEGYGIHTLIWDAADERLGEWLVASPADATGRGIELHVRQGGAAADLTGTNVYFIWKHKKTGVRGCEPFEEIDESLGQFMVYYPAAMCEEEGVVEAQCMVSWDDKAISTRAFTIHVEPVLIGGTESEDGFTLFVETIKRYEDVIEITSDAADAANEAAEAADDAADSASAVAAAIQAAAQRGDYDGADGFSPIATVTQTAEGATISITDANGTTTANVAKGAKGDTGEQGPKGDKGDTGAQGPQGIQGETGPQGEKGDTGATGAQGPKGDTGSAGATGPQGPKGDKGDTGETGPQGPQGETGATGATGPQGPKGDTGATGAQGPQGIQGETGPQGPAGADGTTFTPVSPLSLSNGELSIDLSGYAEESDLAGMFDSGINVLEVGENSTTTFSGYYSGYQVGEVLYSTRSDRLCKVTAIDEAQHKVTAKGVVEFARLRGLIETTLDIAPGQTGSGYTKVGGHALVAGTLLLNVTSGNLMRVTQDVTRPSTTAGSAYVSVEGVGNVYGGGTSYTASSPLAIDSNNDISIDLTGYAETSDLPPTVWYGTDMPGPTEGNTDYYSDVTYKDVRLGDLLLNTLRGNLSRCVFSNGTGGMNCTGILQLAKFRGIVTTTSLDLAAGATGSGAVDSLGHSVCTGTLILNTTTGSLMRATSTANPADASATTVTVSAVGLGNVYGGGASYTASSPLSIDANNDISIDLSGYAALAGATFTGAVSGVTPTANAHFATKKYVDDAIAALDDLSGVSF